MTAPTSAMRRGDKICPRQAKYGALFRPTYCMSVERVESTIDVIRTLYAATTGVLLEKQKKLRALLSSVHNFATSRVDE